MFKVAVCLATASIGIHTGERDRSPTLNQKNKVGVCLKRYDNNATATTRTEKKQEASTLTRQKQVQGQTKQQVPETTVPKYKEFP